MEISNINVCGLMVRFGFVCQTCKQAVEFGDKFCRNCGRKLEQLDRVAKVADVASILTEAFKGRKTPTHKEDSISTESERIGAASSMSGEDAKIEDNKKPPLGFEFTKNLCPKCKVEKCGCAFLQPDGECRAFCYLTNPPRYPKCVYLEENAYERT